MVVLEHNHVVFKQLFTILYEQFNWVCPSWCRIIELIKISTGKIFNGNGRAWIWPAFLKESDCGINYFSLLLLHIVFECKFCYTIKHLLT